MSENILKSNKPSKEELDRIKELDEKEKQEEDSTKPKSKDESELKNHIFSIRATANREDQVMSFMVSNAQRKKLGVYSVIRPHGLRGYIFAEAQNRQDVEEAAYGIPYSRGVLPGEISYKEIEHMLEQTKKDTNIKKGDIAEIISGPFKRQQCKISRVDKAKEEVVVELLEAAVPIPITLKMDAVKVIRREE